MNTNTQQTENESSAQAPSPEKKKIGKVRAVVEFDLIEGDEHQKNSFDWFQYREPGITPEGRLGTATRNCRVVGKPEVILD